MKNQAMLGGFVGSLAGLMLGAIFGIIIGASVVGNRPTRAPSTNGLHEIDRNFEEGGNSVAKILGGAIGAVLGGIVGSAAGAGIGAKVAVMNSNPSPKA